MLTQQEEMMGFRAPSIWFSVILVIWLSTAQAQQNSTSGRRSVGDTSFPNSTDPSTPATEADDKSTWQNEADGVTIPTLKGASSEFPATQRTGTVTERVGDVYSVTSASNPNVTLISGLPDQADRSTRNVTTILSSILPTRSAPTRNLSSDVNTTSAPSATHVRHQTSTRLIAPDVTSIVPPVDTSEQILKLSTSRSDVTVGKSPPLKSSTTDSPSVYKSADEWTSPIVDVAKTSVIPATIGSTTDVGTLGQSTTISVDEVWETDVPEYNTTKATPSSENTSLEIATSSGVPSSGPTSSPDVTSEMERTYGPVMNWTDSRNVSETISVTPSLVGNMTFTTDELVTDEVTGHVTNGSLLVDSVAMSTTPTTLAQQNVSSFSKEYPITKADRSLVNGTVGVSTTATSSGPGANITTTGPPAQSSNILPIAIGASLGALLIILIIILICVLRRRRQEAERKKRYMREEENVMDYVYHPRRPSNSLPPYQNKINGSGGRVSGIGPHENFAADELDVDPATKPAVRNYFQEGLRGLEQNGDGTPPENNEPRPRYDSNNVTRREKKPSIPMRAISAKSRMSMGPVLLTEDSDGQPSTQKTYDKMYSSHSTFRK